MLNRFNGNVVPFADDATSTNRTVFGGTTQSDLIDDNLNTNFKKGWEIVGLNDNPTREDFNAMGYTLGALTAYLYEMGISEWNASQNYRANSRVIGSDGKIYKSLTGTTGIPNVGNNPTSNAVNWQLEIITDYSTLTNKATPIDADLIALGDSTSLFSLKKLTWSNLKATLISSFGVMISTLTAKTTPVDADIFTIGDSAATNASKKLTWANLKSTLFNGSVSLTSNGYIKFPTVMSGLIIQWGLGQVPANTTLPVNYPIAFPGGVLNLVGSIGGASSGLQPLGFVATALKTQFNISNFNVVIVPYFWLSVGY